MNITPTKRSLNPLLTHYNSSQLDSSLGSQHEEFKSPSILNGLGADRRSRQQANLFNRPNLSGNNTPSYVIGSKIYSQPQNFRQDYKDGLNLAPPKQSLNTTHQSNVDLSRSPVIQRRDSDISASGGETKERKYSPLNFRMKNVQNTALAEVWEKKELSHLESSLSSNQNAPQSAVTRNDPDLLPDHQPKNNNQNSGTSPLGSKASSFVAEKPDQLKATSQKSFKNPLNFTQKSSGLDEKLHGKTLTPETLTQPKAQEKYSPLISNQQKMDIIARNLSPINNQHLDLKNHNQRTAESPIYLGQSSQLNKILENRRSPLTKAPQDFAVDYRALAQQRLAASAIDPNQRNLPQYSVSNGLQRSVSPLDAQFRNPPSFEHTLKDYTRVPAKFQADSEQGDFTGMVSTKKLVPLIDQSRQDQP